MMRQYYSVYISTKYVLWNILIIFTFPKTKMEHIRYYIRNTFVNSRCFKLIGWALVASLNFTVEWAWKEMLQLIFVWWVIMMLIGTMAWAKTEGFSFGKFFQGIYRGAAYYIIIFFGLMLDKAFETDFVLKFFYAAIVIDMFRSFLKHWPVLWIGISQNILEFAEKAQKRIWNLFLNKLWLTDDLEEPQETEKNI